MKIRVWLSYDLGIKGDYENLYIWLDKYEALECGDSMATFFWETNNPINIKQEIKDSLEKSISYSKKDRIYLVSNKEDSKYTGSFIIGSRKSSPWEGSSKETTSDDE